MKTSATNRRLRLLLTGINDGTLVPRPEFQRRLVWTNKHKQDFIQTVLLDYPFPEIYVAAGNVDPDTGIGTEMLVDGQQRISTLHQYFVGSQDLRLGELRPYSKLSNDEKIKYLEYEVVVRDLGKKSIEEIRQVFTRINSTKYSLNAMEMHNARFDGTFKQFGEALSQHPFFERHNIFRTNDVRRMGDILFCLTVVITIMSSYFNRDDELEEYLSKFNDDFPDALSIEQELNSVFQFIDDCQLPPTCRAWKKADLLVLLVEVHKLLIREKANLNHLDTSRKLVEFYNMIDAAELIESNDAQAVLVSKYYKASIQATNDRSSRIRRGEVLSDILRQPVAQSLF